MSVDALLLAALIERARLVSQARRICVGLTRDGRVWVATSVEHEHRHAGATLTEACEAWLAAHPAPTEAA